MEPSKLHPVHSTEEAKQWFESNSKPCLCVHGVDKSVTKGVDSFTEAEKFFTFIQGPPPVDNQIGMFMHCRSCLNEKPADISPRDWAQLEVGWTPHGIQIWCKRHELNVCHINFQGRKHPARLDTLNDASNPSSHDAGG